MEFQRDEIHDEVEWEQLVGELRAEVERAREAASSARALGRLGDQLRLAPETRSEAIDVLERAVAAAKRADDGPLLVANNIRLATALQYADRHNEAVVLFIDVLKLIETGHDEPGVTPYKDFALQHLGKCCVEIGLLTPAREYLQQALTLRKDKGDAALIASTEKALNGLKEHV